tara:strand:+ start:196 stop:798 length:603 start_codon:yes stop_codon:yes gene_type:complete
MKIIIITGPSGSGKTRLAKRINQELKNSYILCTDDFYKTGIISNLLSKIIKSYFDRKISLNRKLLKKVLKKILLDKKIDHFFKYNFIKKSRKIYYEESPIIEYLIIEGIFALELLNLFKNKDYLIIKLKISKNICMQRVFNRDQAERGKNKNLIIEDFKNAWDLYIKNINLYKLVDKRRELVITQDIDIKFILEKITKNN